MNQKIVVLIPSYNPDYNLIKIVNDLYKYKFKILIVDDGSDKNCKFLFNECSKKAQVLHHKLNRGKGEALKTGLKYILNNYSRNTLIITCDGDGQHSAIDVLKIVKVLKKNKLSFVIGSRNFTGNVPFRSKIGNYFTRKIFKILTGQAISDTQTGLRGFSYNYIGELIKIPGSRYEYEMKVLIESADKDIIEVPIDTVYFSGNKSSHFRIFKDSFLIYKSFFRR